MDIREYSTYCGPSAFAAITGAPPNHAATTLIQWARRAGFGPTTGTPPMVLHAALLMRGYRLERWSTYVGGWRTEATEAFARRVWRRLRHDAATWAELEEGLMAFAEFHERPRPRAVARALADARRIGAERTEARCLSRYTLAAWMRRRPVGTWILQVPGHLLVQRDGAIVCGDEPDGKEYGGDELLDAWRVLPRVFSMTGGTHHGKAKHLRPRGRGG